MLISLSLFDSGSCRTGNSLHQKEQLRGTVSLCFSHRQRAFFIISRCKPSIIRRRWSLGVSKSLDDSECRLLNSMTS